MVKENDKVLINGNVVPGEKLIIGTVKEVYPNDIVIVELDKDKQLIKCKLEDVTPLSDDEEPLKDIITIDISEFDEAVNKATSPSSYNNLGVLEAGIVCVSGSIVANRIKRELFGSAKND